MYTKEAFEAARFAANNMPGDKDHNGETRWQKEFHEWCAAMFASVHPDRCEPGWNGKPVPGKNAVTNKDGTTRPFRSWDELADWCANFFNGIDIALGKKGDSGGADGDGGNGQQGHYVPTSSGTSGDMGLIIFAILIALALKGSK